jgi:hypothetical protein
MQSVLDQHGVSGSFGHQRERGGGDKYRVSKRLLSFSPVRELTRTIVVASGRRSSPEKRHWPSSQPASTAAP